MQQKSKIKTFPYKISIDITFNPSPVSGFQTRSLIRNSELLVASKAAGDCRIMRGFIPK
jgi:hypothetical protein